MSNPEYTCAHDGCTNRTDLEYRVVVSTRDLRPGYVSFAPAGWSYVNVSNFVRRLFCTPHAKVAKKEVEQSITKKFELIKLHNVKVHRGTR